MNYTDPDPAKRFGSSLLFIYSFLYLKNDVNVPSKRNEHNNFEKRAGSGSVSKDYGSEDPDLQPDPNQNVTDLEYWISFANILI
jgi:hypothetical protein